MNYSLGDLNSVTHLLAAGADPTLGTENEDRNALHLAAMINSPLCLKELLSNRRNGRILDLEKRDVYGQTALQTAISLNCVAAAHYLIVQGSNINNLNVANQSIFVTAVVENAHEGILQLLKAGANYNSKRVDDVTALHLAASDGDLETIQLLTKARLHKFDLEARDHMGRTPQDVACKRDDDPVWTMHWERLVASIRDHDCDTRSVLSMSSDASYKTAEDEAWEISNSAMLEDLHNADIDAAELLEDESTPIAERELIQLVVDATTMV